MTLHLLPSNASLVEQSLSISTDVLQKLGAKVDAISTFKTVPPPSVLPFLIWEYGLSEIQSFFVPYDPARIIQEGLKWQRLRGTPAALHKAFSWIGQRVSIEENSSLAYWARYQLGFPQITTLNEVRRVAALAELSQPARSRLWRIYTDVFDRRPIVLSEKPILGDGWLSWYSGVEVDTDQGDVIVSFGTKAGLQAERYLPFDIAATLGNTLWLGFLAQYLDTFMVGRSLLSDVYPHNHGFTIGSLFSILWADRARSARQWRGFWDSRIWRDYTTYDRMLPLWRIQSRRTSRSELCLSENDSGLGDINARLGTTGMTTIDAPMRLGRMQLSEHDSKRALHLLDNLHQVSTDFVSHAVQPQAMHNVASSLNIAMRIDALRPYPHSWTGQYKTERRWYNYLFPIVWHSTDRFDVVLKRIMFCELAAVSCIPDDVFA